jgi:hypothetical protein
VEQRLGRSGFWRSYGARPAGQEQLLQMVQMARNGAGAEDGHVMQLEAGRVGELGWRAVEGGAGRWWRR